MSGGLVIGKAELAAIRELTRLEAARGIPLTEDERDAFKLGFLGGFSEGLGHASEIMGGEIERTGT